ncbi:hypothetical protein SAE02_78960 [Skermanella aerolata]|uniref:Uncharacterized protein n=1 Tax=Skermanella aerolata TaxID=393310 RepID=A0A512E4T8_9PROT|nr:hypothetical protein [Skermanella aerolata]KJB89952.1 hypothetical protein N826_08890 [Skermanella aerolata KACC 11604]GEO43748.1 hypothetical protein SAE02_78960 [Skermanella aerolata]
MLSALIRDIVSVRINYDNTGFGQLPKLIRHVPKIDPERIAAASAVCRRIRTASAVSLKRKPHLMHPQLAARRLQVLHAELETQKTSLLVWLDQVEDLVNQLHQETGMEICLALKPMITLIRREVDQLDMRSPTSTTQLVELTARFNSVAQAITSCVRAMAAIQHDR